METPQKSDWEKQVIENMLLASLQEQRRARRWGIFFKILGFIYFFLLLLIFSAWRSGDDQTSTSSMRPHTALVKLEGIIAADEPANAENIVRGLRAAFKNRSTKGVVLQINSPGGSPVQSGRINQAIRHLRQKYPDIPFYAVVEDVCTSGGYHVAVAADKIFVDKASLVGSIGVLIDGFGFTETMHKLGVERRLLTAGENKAFLDPYSPLQARHVDYVKTILAQVHHQFIETVKQGRGKRLKEDDKLFSGLVWNGEKSVELGLADGLLSVEEVARELIQAEHIVDFTPKEAWLDRFGRSLGSSATQQIFNYFQRSSVTQPIY